MNIAMDMENDLKLKELHWRLRAKVENFLNKLNHLEISAGIFSGWRTWTEQENLYQQGRTEPGNIVTYAKPGDSLHNYGLACDVWPRTPEGNWNFKATDEEMNLLGTIGKGFGLHWGGDYDGFPDKAHFYVNAGHQTSDLKKIYESEGLAGVWNHIDAVNQPPRV